MVPRAPQRRLVAILSADCVGYSRLMAEDDERTVAMIKAERHKLKAEVLRHGGRVVDAVGDNVLAAFRSSFDALACAVAIQAQVVVESKTDPSESRMRFRIGVHVGDVLLDEGRIYGTGVNVAARLEGIARPGEVALSHAVYEQVQAKLGLEFEDLGEQHLKNIPNPVRVHRVRQGGGEAESAALQSTIPGFGGRPAIAVLPFASRGEGSGAEYLGEAIAESLITRLSRRRVFPVIAHASSCAYDGQVAEIRKVGHDLGARYVVTGSVQRSGERMHVVARLGDASTGHEPWSQRFEGKSVDVLDLQDEIAIAICAAIHPELMRAEGERARRKEVHDLDAWDDLHHALWHLRRGDRENIAAAKALCEKITRRVPWFAPGWTHLALCHVREAMNAWTDSPRVSRELSLQAAQRALTEDDGDPTAHQIVGVIETHRGRHEAAITCFERAIDIDPSHVYAWSGLGQALAVVGRCEEGVVAIERALRLSPRDSFLPNVLADLALAHFGAGRDAEAVRCFERSRSLAALGLTNQALFVASYAWLGRAAEARVEMEALRKQVPGLNLAAVERVARRLNPAAADRVIEGLRRAGLGG